MTVYVKGILYIHEQVTEVKKRRTERCKTIITDGENIGNGMKMCQLLVEDQGRERNNLR